MEEESQKTNTKNSTTSKEATEKTTKQSASKKTTADAKKTTAKLKQPKNIYILGHHNLELCTYIFDDVEKPKAVTLLVHGMQEHCLRYSDFAKFLNKHGYIVVASDLRGHGRTMRSKEEYGRGEEDIFSESVKDQLCILNYIHEVYNLPIYVFGHSYGSMLTQKLIQQTPLIDKAVICGTANGSSFLFKMGNVLATVLAPFKWKDKRGGFEEKLCIKSYCKKFERGNWLTRDEKVFDEYLADELCGGSFPFSFYRSMMKNMAKMNENIDKIGSKKVFLIVGSCDPVGQNAKQVKQLFKTYLKNNVDAKLKVYDGARHELFNETNKDEVYKDVLDFFEK